MNRFFTKALSAFLLLFAINFIISCTMDSCPPPILYYLRDVNVKAIHKIENGDAGFTIEYTDTLWQNIAFEVRPEVQFAALEQTKSFGFMNVAYGECDGNYPLNPALENKSVFSCDKPIYWNGTTLEANTNLLNHQEFSSFIQFPTLFDYERRTIIEIQAENMKFPNGYYNFHFEWQTDDEIILKDEVRVYIKK